jgi:hypothetical protein
MTGSDAKRSLAIVVNLQNVPLWNCIHPASGHQDCRSRNISAVRTTGQATSRIAIHNSGERYRNPGFAAMKDELHGNVIVEIRLISARGS